MHWYLIHTKPKQEKCALDNLLRQRFQCYLPTPPSEKLRQGVLTVVNEPPFPRYLFIRLGLSDSALSWSQIRSAKGVSRLLSFGLEPAKVAARGACSGRVNALLHARRVRPPCRSAVCRHRRYLPDG